MGQVDLMYNIVHGICIELYMSDITCLVYTHNLMSHDIMYIIISIALYIWVPGVWVTLFTFYCTSWCMSHTMCISLYIMVHESYHVHCIIHHGAWITHIHFIVHYGVWVTPCIFHCTLWYTSHTMYISLYIMVHESYHVHFIVHYGVWVTLCSFHYTLWHMSHTIYIALYIMVHESHHVHFIVHYST